MSSLRFRTIAGSVLIAAIALSILLDRYCFDSLRPFGSLILVTLAVLGWGEFARMVGLRGSGAKASAGLDRLGAAAVIFFFLVAYLFGVARDGRSPLLPGSEESWRSGGIAGLILGAFAWVMFREDYERRYGSLPEVLLGGLLLGHFFSYTLRIYQLAGWQGPVLGALFLAGVKGNDTASYYAGKAFGRHRIYKVSPQKTLEGSLGGVVFCALFYSIAGELVEARAPGSLFHWPGGILFGMMISVISQLGDLLESLIKRVYHVKDSGALLPEFGGVLDLIDSLLLTGFFFWALR